MRRIIQRSILAAATVGAALLALACTSGTPAAPEGTEILLRFDFVDGSRDLVSGDFQAIITATLFDEDSNVPQTGVGVFFEVTNGPGTFEFETVNTDNGGRARNVLTADGAQVGNEVTFRAFSGVSTSNTLSLNVEQASGNAPPMACIRSANATGGGLQVTLDIGCSEAPACRDNQISDWEVDWGDGTAPQNLAGTTNIAMHTYASAGSYTIRVTVDDCQNLSSTETTSITL
ncbi:MAG: PKD domain-containing protein [Acidobacteriota bacterium]